MDCSPPFTVVITLSMMVFVCLFYFGLVCFGGGREGCSSCASDESSSFCFVVSKFQFLAEDRGPILSMRQLVLH